ncbi:MAG: DUF1566 domain-containing protein [Deltaproteobacteria bacterium]|nr:DUF1566 domain-containing protein [Deltaproteobacteria bacterium]
MTRRIAIVLCLAALAGSGCGSNGSRDSEDDGGDVGTDSNTGSETGPDTSDTSDSETDTGADTETETNTGTGTDSDTDTGTDTGDAQCGGKDDFTSCSLVTSPDRAYDICSGGHCVSPGCGDASCNAPGPHFRLADTGQRLCFDEVSLIDCQGDPEADTECADTPLCGEDPQYGWDADHAADERFSRDDGALDAGEGDGGMDAGQSEDEPVVRDYATGLEWQGCAAGLGGTACGEGSATALPWADALAYCDGLEWRGRAGWRLPDEYELESIVDYGSPVPSLDPIPAVDPAAFPATPADHFWTSSSYAGDSSYAWTVHFRYGAVYSGIAKDKGCPVRCVRGEPIPHPKRLTRSVPVPGEPVVADSATGLMWQGRHLGDSNNVWWKQALGYCQSLFWGGYTDWRLPNVKELRSLVDSLVVGPAADTAAFQSMVSEWFIASTSYSFEPSSYWMVHFGSGIVIPAVKTTGSGDGGDARCVRAGP